jgi:4-hydroxy 2-oxovalerate aldolase
VSGRPTLYIQDVTLRDGMHALRHRLSPSRVREIASAVDAIAAAEVIENAVLTTLLLPGIGTIAELEKAHGLGVRSVRVATHATEADIAIQHIGKARDLGMDVSGT